MKILALDQSSNKSGVCLMIDGAPFYYSTIDHSKNRNTPARIKHMFLDLIKIVDLHQPDLLVVEAVQQQSSPKTSMLLAQLQGALIGHAYEHNIPVVSPMPVEWRKILGYSQGPRVKREELKQQSFDYVRTHFGLDLSEDEAEAVAMAHAMYLNHK